MEAPKPGKTVYVKATVLRAHGFDREPAYRSVDLQLPDGQYLSTNADNLVELPTAPAEEKQTKEKPAKEKSPEARRQ